MSAGSVVVVDDSAVNRMLLGGILQQAGYDVRVAGGGGEALHMIVGNPPEVVLLDIQMPDMTGYDVCRHLKARAELAAIPVVFISALDDVVEKVKGFEIGGVDYVTKPFEPAEVLARVGTQVRLFRLQRELTQRNAELERRNQQLVQAEQKTERLFLAFSDVLTGMTLDDTYRLEEKIGEGGFGAVYRAVHIPLQRPVAVKVLQPTSKGEIGVEIARFRREGIAACRVAHPNAVEVLDFGISSRGIAYLVMELLTGNTMSELLLRERRISVRRAAEIVVPVCEALAAAHAAGIVHRDVKPDNVFLHQTPQGEVAKVLDFGIAKLMDDMPEPVHATVTQMGTLVGTPPYIAPERLLGRPYDSRSDVYSVGVLLYYALSGELPFAHTPRLTVADMVNLHLMSRPRPLRTVNGEVPEEVEGLVMQTLDIEPPRRPAIREVGARLRLFAS